MNKAIVAILLVAIWVSACGGGAGDCPDAPTVAPPAPTQITDRADLERVVRELEANEELWQSQGIDDYSILLERQAFAPVGETGVFCAKVEHGRVTSLHHDGDSIDTELAGRAPFTVEGLFDLIESWSRIAEQVPDTGFEFDVTLHYDSEMGYPTWMTLGPPAFVEGEVYVVYDLNSDAEA